MILLFDKKKGHLLSFNFNMTADDVITDEQRHIDHLRRRLRGQMNDEMFRDDNFFLRFLRARNHNLHAAEDMIRKHLHWRQVNKVDEILHDFKTLEVLKKYFSGQHIGFDLEGAPISYVGYGGIDTKGLLKCVKLTEITRFVVHHLESEVENLKRQTVELGKPIEKWVYILNFENLSLSSATDKTTVDFIIALLKTYDGNYPERLKTAYVINASFYFTLIWTIIKPFLAEATVNKVRIFGKDGWKDELRKTISPDVIPKFLGGERTDPDGNPMCDSFICHGGTVPSKYFVTRDRKSFSKLPGVKKLVVNRRSKVDIIIEVEEPGSNIEWDFDVKNRDIGFSLFFKDSSDKKDEELEVVPKQRIDTQLFSESGMVRIDRPGKYVLQFDNTFSWMHNKEIYYSTYVTKPDEYE